MILKRRALRSCLVLIQQVTVDEYASPQDKPPACYWSDPGADQLADCRCASCSQCFQEHFIQKTKATIFGWRSLVGQQIYSSGSSKESPLPFHHIIPQDEGSGLCHQPHRSALQRLHYCLAEQWNSFQKRTMDHDEMTNIDQIGRTRWWQKNLPFE